MGVSRRAACLLGWPLLCALCALAASATYLLALAAYMSPARGVDLRLFRPVAPRLPLTFEALHAHQRQAAEGVHPLQAPSPLRGVILYLAGSSPPDVADLLASLTSLSLFYLAAFPSDVLILVEGGELESAHGPSLRSAAGPRATLRFVDISAALVMPWHTLLSLPVWIFPSGVRWALHKRGLFSYGRMCRFLARPFADLPALADYDFFWRLDTDSRLTAPAPEDVFARMARKRALYGYSTFTDEGGEYIEGLLAAADAHAARRRIAPTFYHRLRREPASGNWWQFWTNFEVGSLALLRSPEARALFDALDAASGFFEHRWGDAPARLLLLSLHVELRAIHRFCDIGYEHGHVRVLPQPVCANASSALDVDAALAQALLPPEAAEEKA